MAQGVGAEAVGEGEEAVRKVVLGQPRDDAALLHVGPAGDVDDQVAELLPVAHHVDGAGAHLGVAPRHRHRRRERAVDAEHHRLRLPVRQQETVIAAQGHVVQSRSVAMATASKRLGSQLFATVSLNGSVHCWTFLDYGNLKIG